MDKTVRKTTKKPSKIDEMSKEQIRQAILKKRECNVRAQQIVESLLEKGISETYFIESLPNINQSHLEDVIEERSITRLCGYPLCQEALSQEIPKQQYRISMKTNKVYDITARKSFCSNSCYKSAMYIKNQMLTSPLWCREYEKIPTFTLLPLDTVGSLGQEVDVSLIDRKAIKVETDTFTSVFDFTSASLNEIVPNKESNENLECAEKKKADDRIKILDTQEKKDTDKNNIETQILSPITTAVNINSIEIATTQTNSTEQDSKTKLKNPVKNPLNIIGEIIEKPEQKLDPILTNPPLKTEAKIKTPNKKVHKEPTITLVIIEVEKCLAEWFTMDTMLFLFGEARVREMVADKGECIKEYLNNYAKSLSYSSHSYDLYQDLCRKLNMLELEDRRLDAQTIQRESKPLPDYSIIKEESKKMQLKVKAFFEAETNIPEPSQQIEDKSVPSEEPLTQLPLVDKNAQNALRRRIVCQHLNKVLPDILRSLGLSALSINSDVKLLVNTFKLQANNVMFKPIQWTLIAMVIVKLLSLRDSRLEYLLQQNTASKHMQLLLLSFKQDDGYLDRLIFWLTDIDRLLDTNDTQLTIELCK